MKVKEYYRGERIDALTKNLIMVLTAPEEIWRVNFETEPLRGSKITLQATIETPDGARIQGASEYVYATGTNTIIRLPGKEAS